MPLNAVIGLTRRDRAIIATGILGVIVSTYALYVELSAEAKPGYKALCDLSENASCSRVLTSEYAKGFGLYDTEVPNSIFGILYYCLMIFLATFQQYFLARLQFIVSFIAVASSVYLAGLLIFVLHDFCIVCVSTYFLNAILAFLIYNKYKMIQAKNK